MFFLNGRGKNNGFTSVSTNGRAVVDYCFVSHSSLGCFSNFSVTRNCELISQSGSLTVPDHSLLKWNFEFDSGGGKSANASSEHSYTNGDFYRFDVSNVSKNFLDDDALLFRVNDTISKLESSVRLQSDIDGVYSDWCRILKDEMLKQLPMIKRKKTSSNSTKNKKHRPNKPWWSDKLSMVICLRCRKTMATKPVSKRCIKKQVYVRYSAQGI